MSKLIDDLKATPMTIWMLVLFVATMWQGYQIITGIVSEKVADAVEERDAYWEERLAQTVTNNRIDDAIEDQDDLAGRTNRRVTRLEEWKDALSAEFDAFKEAVDERLDDLERPDSDHLQ